MFDCFILFVLLGFGGNILWAFLTWLYLILRFETFITKSKISQFSLVYWLEEKSSNENSQELHLNLEVKFIAQAHLQFRLFLPLCERQTSHLGC